MAASGVVMFPAVICDEYRRRFGVRKLIREARMKRKKNLYLKGGKRVAFADIGEQGWRAGW